MRSATKDFFHQSGFLHGWRYRRYLIWVACLILGGTVASAALAQPSASSGAELMVIELDLAGLGLVLLGLAMIVGEAFLPSFGVLGVGGIAAFVAGSILLMGEANSSLAWPLIGGTALIAAGFLLWAVMRLIGVRRRTPQAGTEELLGARTSALTDFRAGRGKVLLHGERWQARGDSTIRRGQVLRVTALEGLTVTVAPLDAEGPEDFDDSQKKETI